MVIYFRVFYKFCEQPQAIIIVLVNVDLNYDNEIGSHCFSLLGEV